ncbi:hypothetical protein [Demequina sp. SO4-18]|uniref:hypothetical protein n=1 Tax=Demequina sp. SO4-18 TaxID=3401026 RepID=UPI003B5B039D
MTPDDALTEVRTILTAAGVTCPPTGIDPATVSTTVVKLHAAGDDSTAERLLMLTHRLESPLADPRLIHAEDQMRGLMLELDDIFERTGVPQPPNLTAPTAFRPLVRHLIDAGDYETLAKLHDIATNLIATGDRLNTSGGAR